MQNVIVDVPQNALLALLELEDTDIPNEELPDYVIEVIGNCLTTINQVRLVLEQNSLDSDNYFKSKSFASSIDSMGPDGNRCPMRIFFSQNARSALARDSVIDINQDENAWISDFTTAFADAICGKTVYGFSDTDLKNINLAREKIGLGPLV